VAIQRFSFPAESHVASGEYDPGDPEKGTAPELVVQFKGGGVYQYHGVPQEIVDRLKVASSPGRALNEEVKGKFQFTKLA